MEESGFKCPGFGVLFELSPVDHDILQGLSTLSLYEYKSIILLMEESVVGFNADP